MHGQLSVCVLLLAAWLPHSSQSGLQQGSFYESSFLKLRKADAMLNFIVSPLRGGMEQRSAAVLRNTRRTVCMSNAPKEFWVLPSSLAVLNAAVESSFTTFVLPKELANCTAAKIHRFTLDDNMCVGDSGRRLPVVSISDEESAQKALEFVRGGGAQQVFVNATEWGIINSENLVAAAQAGKTKVMMLCDSADQAQTLLASLEKGVDGVVLQATNTKAIKDLAALKAAIEDNTTEELTAATVTHVSVLGIGDRVCVDLISNLNVGEGLLVGSSSKALCLVHAETVPNAFCAPRPFRVNAGAVMSYVALPGGKAAYLSELRAGDAVLVVAPDGKRRAVCVGRVKLERRPMLMLNLEIEGGEQGVVILQNVETVRLVGAGGGGESVSVAEVREGERVLVRREGGGGRHLGMRVDEVLVER